MLEAVCFCCACEDGTEIASNTTISVELNDVGLVLMSVMGALDFAMIAIALLTAFNTRSVSK